jgi:endonuclease YncB( thermonuclease family)
MLYGGMFNEGKSSWPLSGWQWPFNVATVILAMIVTEHLVSQAAAQSPGGAIISGRATAKDGDSVLIGAGKGRVEVRIHGIDAPEREQECKDEQNKTWSCGADAETALAGLVNGRELRCEVTDLEPGGARRPIARCLEGSVSISAEMIRRGMAWAFDKYLRKFEDYGALKKLEDEARAQRIGIWKGEAEPAWKFRESRWERYSARAPSKCPIIGNEKSLIYFTPWSRGYTRMFENLIGDPHAKGKRWFCNDSEAVAAGFRPSR